MPIWSCDKFPCQSEAVINFQLPWIISVQVSVVVPLLWPTSKCCHCIWSGFSMTFHKMSQNSLQTSVAWHTVRVHCHTRFLDALSPVTWQRFLAWRHRPEGEVSEFQICLNACGQENCPKSECLSIIEGLERCWWQQSIYTALQILGKCLGHVIKGEEAP